MSEGTTPMALLDRSRWLHSNQHVKGPKLAALGGCISTDTYVNNRTPEVGERSQYWLRHRSKLVPRQLQHLQVTQLLQHGRHAVEPVVLELEHTQALQLHQLGWQLPQTVAAGLEETEPEFKGKYNRQCRSSW